MKIRLKQAVCTALVMTLALVPLTRATAQEAQPAAAKPAVVVSLASMDELLADVGYLSRAAGAQVLGGMVTGIATQYAQSLDTSKPSGVYVSIDEQGQPAAIGFVAVNDLDAFLAQFKDQIGQPEDVGNGVKRVALQQPVFVKKQGPYAFVSDSAEKLTNLPEDPAPILGQLDQQYDIAVRLYVQNVPAPLRNMAVAQITAQFEQQMAQQADQQDEATREMTEQLSRNSLRQITSLIEDAETVTMGWNIDSQEQTTYFDVQLTAAEGTPLAQRMSLVQDVESHMTGFNLPEAALTLHGSSRFSEQDKQQFQATLAVVRDKAMKALDEDEGLKTEEARQAAKDVLNELLQVVQNILESGRSEGGATVVLEPETVTFAFGLFVADGAKVEDAFKKLVELAKSEPDFPQVNFDAETHAGVRFHTMQIPIPADEADARRLLGENLDTTIGIGEDAFYLAFGKENRALLKKIIDNSATAGSDPVPPGEMNIDVGAIMKFAASMQDDPMLTSLAQTLEQAGDQDHVTLTVTAVPRGIQYRLLIEQGVLKVIGQAAQQAGAAPGGQR